MKRGKDVKTIRYLPGLYVAYREFIDDLGPYYVFCGITPVNPLCEYKKTTATDIALILETLAKELHRPVPELRFYELSTHLSWVCRVGQYDFQQIKVVHWSHIGEGGKNDNVTWEQAACPDEVRMAFSSLIGTLPHGGSERLPRIFCAPFTSVFDTEKPGVKLRLPN